MSFWLPGPSLEMFVFFILGDFLNKNRKAFLSLSLHLHLHPSFSLLHLLFSSSSTLLPLKINFFFIIFLFHFDVIFLFFETRPNLFLNAFFSFFSLFLMAEERKEVRVGVVGAGIFAQQSYAPVLKNSKKFRVVAVCRSVCFLLFLFFCGLID